MSVIAEHENQSLEIASRETHSDARAPWHRPVLTCLGASDAETGVNSTTDATQTFS